MKAARQQLPGTHIGDKEAELVRKMISMPAPYSWGDRRDVLLLANVQADIEKLDEI